MLTSSCLQDAVAAYSWAGGALTAGTGAAVASRFYYAAGLPHPTGRDAAGNDTKGHDTAQHQGLSSGGREHSGVAQLWGLPACAPIRGCHAARNDWQKTTPRSTGGGARAALAVEGQGRQRENLTARGTTPHGTTEIVSYQTMEWNRVESRLSGGVTQDHIVQFHCGICCFPTTPT